MFSVKLYGIKLFKAQVKVVSQDQVSCDPPLLEVHTNHSSGLKMQVQCMFSENQFPLILSPEPGRLAPFVK